MADREPSRGSALAALALATLLGMSTWFSGTAVSGALRAEWQLSAGAAAWLTIAVQLGFVAGALVSALTNLVDVWPPRRIMIASCVLVAGCNALFAYAPAFAPGLVARFATGVFLAGVYPSALKLVATWFRDGRGRALGIMVGALTLGSAAPHLVRGIPGLDARTVVLAASALTLLGGAVTALAVHEGPFAFPRARFDPAQSGRVLRDRGVRLACLGYFGHMWELYAMWGWIAVFLTDVFAPRGADASVLAARWAFAVIGAGFVGSWWAGVYSDRVGRTMSAALAMAVSAACALAIGFTLHGPLWLTLAIALVWGTAVVADSAQFSTMVTELADPSYVGTALTLQLSLGFLLTVPTLWLVPLVRDHAGWGVAFALLVPGPLLGMFAVLRLRSLPEAARLAGGRG